MTVAVRAAGVDTWSPAWRVTSSSTAGGMLDELCTVPTKLGFMAEQAVDGHRVIWSAQHGLLWAEGHPPGAGGDLLSPELLPQALGLLTGSMLEAGYPLPNGISQDFWDGVGPGTVAWDGFAGIRRLDSTVDLQFDSAAEGLAVLAGVAALTSQPGANKGEVITGSDGRIETVYVLGHGGRTKLGRWYDKGVESGDAPRGRLIRPEDQRRFVKGTRRAPEELTSTYVRSMFQRRFMPLWQASKGVTVAGPIVLAQKILDAIEDETVTPEMGEKLAGHLLLSAAAGRSGAGVSRSTRYRRELAIRELGLVPADGALEEIEVRLEDVLDVVMDASAWAPNQG
ncbi:MAG TPA: hypothetical protein VHZ31_08895 [Solirubrobacteraceae bacterium]|jgi:hypothetical protein|nr:hypothetical protein [Solirubrobacteraceae bacterium]